MRSKRFAQQFISSLHSSTIRNNLLALAGLGADFERRRAILEYLPLWEGLQQLQWFFWSQIKSKNNERFRPTHSKQESRKKGWSIAFFEVSTSGWESRWANKILKIIIWLLRETVKYYFMDFVCKGRQNFVALFDQKIVILLEKNTILQTDMEFLKKKSVTALLEPKNLRQKRLFRNTC